MWWSLFQPASLFTWWSLLPPARLLMWLKLFQPAHPPCTDLPNGLVDPGRLDLLDQIFLCNLMERYAVQLVIPCLHKSEDPNTTALSASSTVLVFAIAALVRSVSSVKNLRQPSKRGASVRFVGPSLLPHLFRLSLHLTPLKLRRLWLSPCHLNLLPNPLLSLSYGEIGNAVKSAVDGCVCFAHKPSTSPLALFNQKRRRNPSPLRCIPEHNGRIGASVGMSAWLAMLAFLRIAHLR